MNSTLSTLSRPKPHLKSSSVLNQNGYTGTLLTLEPGSASLLSVNRAGNEQLLFVIEGGITISIENVTTVINRDQVSLVAPGRAPVMANPGATTARVMRMEIPARQVVAPLLITPPS